MKTATELYYNDIVPTLDEFNEMTETEKQADEKQFFTALKNKDTEFLDYIITLFDEDLQEEKIIIDNIKYLLKG